MARGKAITPEIRKQMVDMYMAGMSTNRISAHFGVTQDAARSNIRRELGPLRRSGAACPYSADCFHCPLPDCMGTYAYKYNTLPGERHMVHALGRDDDA